MLSTYSNRHWCNTTELVETVNVTSCSHFMKMILAGYTLDRNDPSVASLSDTELQDQIEVWSKTPESSPDCRFTAWVSIGLPKTSLRTKHILLFFSRLFETKYRPTIHVLFVCPNSKKDIMVERCCAGWGAASCDERKLRNTNNILL